MSDERNADFVPSVRDLPTSVLVYTIARYACNDGTVNTQRFVDASAEVDRRAAQSPSWTEPVWCEACAKDSPGQPRHLAASCSSEEPPMSLWHLADRADHEARQIADRHYSRQKPGTPQFVKPGRCLVLKRRGAYWVTSYPYARFVKHEWAGAMECSAFRRESGPLASDLITSALKATLWKARTDPKWGGVPTPAHGWPLVTFVNRDKVKGDGANPGYCFLRANFEVIGETKAGLLALGISRRWLVDALDECAPVGAQMGFAA